jgi:hypothetical protein
MLGDHNAKAHAIEAAVGKALASWSGVEIQLANLFCEVSGIPDHRRGQIIMASIINFDARIQVCHEMMRLFGWEARDLKVWDKLFARIQKLQKRRNDVAHFAIIMGNVGGKQVDVCLAPYFSLGNEFRGKVTQLSAAQILERAASFRELDQAVRWYAHLAFTRRKPGLVTPAPTPDLVLRLQELVEQTPEGSAPQPQSSEE